MLRRISIIRASGNLYNTIIAEGSVFVTLPSLFIYATTLLRFCRAVEATIYPTLRELELIIHRLVVADALFVRTNQAFDLHSLVVMQRLCALFFPLQ